MYQLVSVVVCTRNEVDKIARLLDSVQWADQVLVLDCGSTDGTQELARAAGADVQEQTWLGFSAQKNEAARRARNDWILSVDADEVVDAELGRALRDALAGDPRPEDGYVVDRRGDFLGVLLPNSTRRAKRKTLVRLYHRGHSSWDESMSVHEVVRVPGRLHRLEGRLLHLNHLTIASFVQLFDRYATLEAQALALSGARAGLGDLTLRPVARFVWHFLFMGEWRLGRRGAAHAGLKAMSDFLRYAKLYELQVPSDTRLTGAAPSLAGPDLVDPIAGQGDR